MRPILVALCFLSAFHASIVVAQPASPAPPVEPTPPPLWSGKADLGYAATTGNTSTSSLGSDLDVVYRPAPWSIEGTFAFLRAEAQQQVTAESFAAAVKGSRDLTARLDVFLQAAYLRNTFSGIEHRTGDEAGAGYKIFNDPNLLLRAESAVGYAKEARTDDTTLSYATGRVGTKLVWKFSKTADFTEEASWTEDFSDTKHWLFRNTASVSAALTKVLSLKVSHALIYSNEPVPGFGKTDTTTLAAIVAKF